MIQDPWASKARWIDNGQILNAQKTADRARVTSASGKIDLIVVGSGSGGGLCAELLARAGARVLIIESGSLYTVQDFDGSESLYEKLYRNGLLLATKNGEINLLQGACVGGSATVNWTSSFRLPSQTLEYWKAVLGLDIDVQSLSSAFAGLESRLHIRPWILPPNANNSVLSRGAQKLGWHYDLVPRNVKGCWDLGFCGLGCPINAKQSPLVTTIPGALEAGASLAHGVGVERLLISGKKVQGVVLATGERIYAEKVALAAGAINTPGILLRSQLAEQLPMVGKNSCLHPSCFSLARFEEKTNPFYGAPQSIYSDEFLWPGSDVNNLGFKLEAIPLQPVLASGLFSRTAQDIALDMDNLNCTTGMIALLRDGFSNGKVGRVELAQNGMARLYYKPSALLLSSMKRALLEMARCQFEAGALSVRCAHLDATKWMTSFKEVQMFLNRASFAPYKLSIGSAHLMGGAAMGGSPINSVVNELGEVHGLKGVSVVDGSVFPTSLGVNPQLSIMAFSQIISQNIQKSFNSVT